MHLSRAVRSALVLAVCLWPAFAAAADGDSVTVTIYNVNRALINETREMNIPQGTQTVEFKDVAETIDPASLQVRSVTSPEAFRILDQNYEYDLITVQSLLDKYVGKQLKVVIADPKGAQNAKVVRDATLLANNERPVFMLENKDAASSSAGNEIYVGNYDAVLLPQVPAGLRPQPTLVWQVENRGDPRQKINVSYLAGNMNWRADYVLQLDRSNAKASLAGWVTLDNQSGKAFKQASLKLVAGDVHLVSRQEGRPEATLKRGMAAPAEELMKEEGLFEYHLYSLGRPVDIGNKQTKQVALLQSPELKIEKRLVGRWSTDRYDSAARGITKEKLAVLLKFNNTRENGIGLPLPKGIVRAYQESADGSVVFIGEDTIDHTGKERDVELKAGDSFDVTVERKQTDFRKTGQNAVRYGWELKLKNGRDTAQKVELEESFPSEWRLLNASSRYDKIDARTIRFTVDAQPSSKGQDSVITYEAEVTW